MKNITTSDTPPLTGLLDALRGLIKDFERLQLSTDQPAVKAEANRLLKPLQTPREFLREPVMLEFLGLPDNGIQLESSLEQALIRAAVRQQVQAGAAVRRGVTRRAGP